LRAQRIEYFILGSSLGERAEIEPDERSSILSVQPVADRAGGLARFLSHEYAETD
jgi:hypothetical protein